MAVTTKKNLTEGPGFVIVWRDDDFDGADLVDVLQACAQEAERQGETHCANLTRQAADQLDQRFRDRVK